MDEITNLIVSASVGGAAGSFIKEITSNGVKWLIDLITAQSPEMQAIAKNNMENFVTRLAMRVERLERELPAEKSEIFKNSLNHPSSALLIKNATIDAATTDNEEKHELLAELIAQRLTANADDMIALVDCLSSRQIKILAVLTTVKDIRPTQKFKATDNAIVQKNINTWWNNTISPLVSDGVLKYSTPLDYEHLVAMGCIRISIGSTDLLSLLSTGMAEIEVKLEESQLSSQNWYNSLKEQWNGLGHSTTTSTGRIIGILHRDAKLKKNTTINW